MATQLNLDDIKSERELPDIGTDSNLVKEINDISKTNVPTKLDVDSNNIDEESIDNMLDQEIYEEERKSLITVLPEDDEKVEQPLTEEENEKIIDQELGIVKEEQKKIDEEAKDYVDDILSDENLELDEDEIYKRKEQEKKDKKEREESRQRFLELKESYTEQVINSELDDLRGYKFAKSTISLGKLFNGDLTTNRVGVWGLYNSGVSVAMTEIGGPEMEILTQQTSDNDLIDQVSTFEIIHKHVVDNNKGTMEEYFKRFTYLDLRDLFFTVYKSSFKGSNYGSFNCTNEKCKKMFMSHMNFKDMVVYPNEEVEARMKAIINKDPNSSSIIKKKLIHISPEYACTIDIPSIYKIVFEQRMISAEFRRKNEDLNNTLMYIDEIFYKDRENRMLVNIDTRHDPNNMSQSVKRKMAIYSKILMRITSDQYAHLKQQINDYIGKYNDDKVRIKYQLPEVKCPHCGTVIKAQEMDPLTMVFIRHQLGRLLSIKKN